MRAPFALVLATLTLACVRVAANDDAVAPVGVTTKPLKAQWAYSRDGGKTFGTTPPHGAPPNAREGIVPLTFRGTFVVDDPKAAAGLWVRIAEPGDAPKAAICTGDLTAASGGYWKDLGFCPTLLNARVALNGKPVKLTNGPMLYFWLPIEGELKKGENTVELSGDCYTYWASQAATAITARLVVAAPQPAAIFNGPLLGDFGDGYFTLACRTRLPAELVVEATPTDPPGKPVRAAAPRATWHRVKVPLPAGTRAARYTLTSKVGTHESASGPFAVKFPGAEFTFVGLGNVMAHKYGVEGWGAVSARAAKFGPAFVLNTGNCSEHGTWEFEWERRYFAPAGKLLASVPTFVTPCARDFAGAVNELHYTPAADTYAHNWSKAVAPVRLIGLDGNQTWGADGANTKWLDKELAAAKEKYVFVLEGYPGYSSGKHSNKLRAPIVQTREVILPLLAKHKVSALVSGFDPGYERCEPPADKGCTQLVTGAAGKETFQFSGTAMRLNPYGKGEGRDWAGTSGQGVRSFCVFEVTARGVELRAYALPGDPTGELKEIDRKLFQPRDK